MKPYEPLQKVEQRRAAFEEHLTDAELLALYVKRAERLIWQQNNRQRHRQANMKYKNKNREEINSRHRLRRQLKKLSQEAGSA